MISTTRFDADAIVSVFEVNIRMLGGLIGGHVTAVYLRDKHKDTTGYLSWYKNELLEMAHQLGNRLLPAFNTSTGIPLPRVNLRHGITNELKSSDRDRYTCTACAGTLLLEFAALSRLTGDKVFESKARQSLDFGKNVIV